MFVCAMDDTPRPPPNMRNANNTDLQFAVVVAFCKLPAVSGIYFRW